MKVKVEETASQRIKKLESKVQKVIDVVPAEHLRGLAKIVQPINVIRSGLAL